MIRLWASIANKLGISQEHALLLHAFLRGWLNKIAIFQARIIVNEIVERFGLEDDPDAQTYGQQLLARHILSPTEAELFAGNYHADQEQPAADEPTERDLGEPAPVGRIRKLTRGPSARA